MNRLIDGKSDMYASAIQAANGARVSALLMRV